ncbi:MAG: hypothetical protein ACOCQV_03645, partial [Halolamina sp.]
MFRFTGCALGSPSRLAGATRFRSSLLHLPPTALGSSFGLALWAFGLSLAAALLAPRLPATLLAGLGLGATPGFRLVPVRGVTALSLSSRLGRLLARLLFLLTVASLLFLPPVASLLFLLTVASLLFLPPVASLL